MITFCTLTLRNGDRPLLVQPTTVTAIEPSPHGGSLVYTISPQQTHPFEVTEDPIGVRETIERSFADMLTNVMDTAQETVRRSTEDGPRYGPRYDG